MQGVSAGNVLMPLRQFMPLPSGDGRLAWMPGYLGEPECFGIKLLSLFPGNPRVGLSSHVGLYVLYESAHGRPVAIMEASALTAIRTAAASVVATQALARPDSQHARNPRHRRGSALAHRCVPGRAPFRAGDRVGTQSGRRA